MNPTVSNGPVLQLFDIVDNTLTNTEGLKLHLALQAALQNQAGSVTLSLLNLTAFSSSFLNSSFGALYEQQGADFMKRIRLTNYKLTQLQQLKDYLTDVAQLQQSE
ncbi:STAS-like domain-containing protein [Hymenobacter algoricola]|uniref:DUF4325 domain-containing protein n=1 Tax=Hymenobacter algoricola TaxID=486267 RepID=A0ABP7M9M7_9BACT